MYIILKQSKGEILKEASNDMKIPIKTTKVSKNLNKMKGENTNIDSEKLSERQKKIVSILEKEGEVYPSKLQELLPNVSTRTIRRDMTDLEKKKIVEQKGSTKSTYYIYIK
ncbi:MAG: DeoR family transcriptional regulator [Clostridia bacterium]|nr:DeoR family transcriptional regulator [Clostridia bacterium]